VTGTEVGPLGQAQREAQAAALGTPGKGDGCEPQSEGLPPSCQATVVRRPVAEEEAIAASRGQACS
jgi:hypothetical protein